MDGHIALRKSASHPGGGLPMLANGVEDGGDGCQKQVNLLHSQVPSGCSDANILCRSSGWYLGHLKKPRVDKVAPY